MFEIQPLSLKQRASLQNSTARLNIWEGAVRSGKSYASLLRFLDFVINGPTGNLLICGRTNATIKRNIIGPLCDLLGSDVRYYSNKQEMQLWGRTVFIIGAADDRAQGKIQGSTLAGAYCDEITLLPESFFKMLLSRLSIAGAKLFGTTNPDSPFHWFKRDFLDRKHQLDLKSFQFLLDDNPALPVAYVRDLKSEYQGLWYQRYIEGKWVLADGTVYDAFDQNLHVIPFPPKPAQFYIVGVDYGTVNPFAAALIGCHEGAYPNLWLEEEVYYDSKKHLRQKTDTEYAEDLRKLIAGKNVRAIYCDPSATSFRLECSRIGISCIEAENEVLDGIRHVSKLLYNGTFKITQACKNTIMEFGAYVWDTKCRKMGVDKPLKESDHILDAIRYALFSHSFFDTGSVLTAQDLGRMFTEARGGSPLPGIFGDKGHRFY